VDVSIQARVIFGNDGRKRFRLALLSASDEMFFVKN